METENPKEPTQVCSMQIAFPVTSDDEAIAYKKKITEILAECPNAQIRFTIATPTLQPQMPMR